MKDLRELYPSIQLVFSFDFAEVFVCFVGFLSGESAVSVAAVIKGRAIDEATISSQKGRAGISYNAVKMMLVEFFFSGLKIGNGSHNYCVET